MKLWIKYLLGTVLGIFSAFVLPEHIIEVLAEFAVRFGRYTLMPLLFFSVSVAVFRLHTEKKSLRTGVWIVGTVLVLSLGLTVLGLLTGLLFRLPPIPTSNVTVPSVPTIEVKTMLLSLFPSNGFHAVLDGAFLLPCFIFAAFAGAGCTADTGASRPVTTLLDSASKVCYVVMSFFLEVLAVGMIALAARWMLTFIEVQKLKVFMPLLVLLLADFLLLAFVGVPLVLRFFCHELHPFRLLYASICPILVAFISGDTNLALQAQIRCCKENLGIRRRINGVALPFYSVFARGGAALVMAISVITILHSYSKLGISFASVLWIAAAAFVLSFLLGGLPENGPFVAITVMCGLFGRGITDGYLLLLAVAPLLCSFAAAIDAVEAITATFIVAVKTKNVEHIEVRKFI